MYPSLIEPASRRGEKKIYKIDTPSHFLIIDDLGVERKTEYALEMVFGVIDGRYRSRKPLIITTNLTWKALSHKEGLDMMHQRIYSRVLEICQPVFFSDLDLREENASKKREELSKILSG